MGKTMTLRQLLRKLAPSEQLPANELADSNGDYNKVQDQDKPTHTQSQDNTGLLVREVLAKDFLHALIRTKNDAHESYNSSKYVRAAFRLADEFLQEANSYRGECEMEELV